MKRIIKVGIIPFGDDSNPYQELTRRTLISGGCKVRVFPKSNFFPLLRAIYSGIDVLHIDWAHSFYLGRNSSSTLIKKLLFITQLLLMDKVRIVWTVHNLVTHNTEGRHDDILKNLVKKVDALISLSQSGIEVIKRKWPISKGKIIFYVPHGHYINWYNTNIDKTFARNMLGFPYNAKIAITVGRLHPYKGIKELIPAFKKISRHNEWLILAGKPLDNNFGKFIRRMINNHPRIIFIDHFLSKKELELVVSAADFAVMPFKEIFNSGSVILAMSFGLPIVATNKGAIPEIVPEEAWFNAGKGTENDISIALKEAFNSDDLIERGLVAKKKLLRYHSWETVGNRLLTLYNMIIEK